MPNQEQIKKYNNILHKKLSVYLNFEPDYIKENTLKEIVRECDLGCEEAYSYLLASAMYMDVAGSEEDRKLFEMYFPYMVHQLDSSEYESDPYMLEICIPEIRDGAWETRIQKYAPYEAFVFDDFRYMLDSRVIPQIGFFTREYRYPAVLHNGREWMLITPNEINTMKKPISKSHGKVLTFGLGLGYFAFMCALRDQVESVTVIECDKSVADIFERYIRPQMSCADKVKVIIADAYEYAEHEMKSGGYDYVFYDIWHDPSDGVEAYLHLKQYEHLLPNAEFDYWIEDTLKYYL